MCVWGGGGGAYKRNKKMFRSTRRCCGRWQHIEWEVQKRFEGMTPEEIDGLSLNEYEVYEEGRTERNAGW